MKRYWYDWEFDESTIPGKIMPISVGMVDDAGRTIYLINQDYITQVQQGYLNPSQWLQDNVLAHITEQDYLFHGCREEQLGPILQMFIANENTIVSRDEVELWAYYAAYDHVVLAQRFGTMLDLPEPIPMNTLDIKQSMSEVGITREQIGFDPIVEHHPVEDAKWNRRVWELLHPNA
jgi:hypothetical protein